MAYSQKIAVAAIAATALTLSGCGGGGGDAPDDGGVTPQPHIVTTQPQIVTSAMDKTTTAAPRTPEPTAEPTAETTAEPTTTQTTQTTTTTTEYCSTRPVVPATPDTEEGRLVDQLNSWFTGYNESDSEGAVGVTIQKLIKPNDAKIRCGSGCHAGAPDCWVSATLYNQKMPLMPDTHFAAMDTAHGRWNFGLVFNQTAVEADVGKCAYMYEAHSFARVNRGCGCASKYQANCGQQAAPYQNQDCKYESWDVAEWTPIPGSCKNNTESTKNVESCWCKSQDRAPMTPSPEDMTTTSQQCYFRLPAMYPPNGVFPSELHEMVTSRIANQEAANETLEDGRIRWRQEYWNEVILDGERLDALLSAGNPRHAVAAIIYIRGMGGLPYARQVQRYYKKHYGGPKVPIVEMDTKVDATCSGPFRVQEDSMETREEALLV